MSPAAYRVFRVILGFLLLVFAVAGVFTPVTGLQSRLSLEKLFGTKHSFKQAQNREVNPDSDDFLYESSKIKNRP